MTIGLKVKREGPQIHMTLEGCILLLGVSLQLEDWSALKFSQPPLRVQSIAISPEKAESFLLRPRAIFKSGKHGR